MKCIELCRDTLTLAAVKTGGRFAAANPTLQLKTASHFCSNKYLQLQESTLEASKPQVTFVAANVLQVFYIVAKAKCSELQPSIFFFFLPAKVNLPLKVIFCGCKSVLASANVEYRSEKINSCKNPIKTSDRR